MGRGLIFQRSRRSFPTLNLRQVYLIRYYHMFPCAIPNWKADYPRVTHPSAALGSKKDLTARLACLKRAASVRSEPGSNSPLSKSREQVPDYSFLLQFILSYSHEPAFFNFPFVLFALTEASGFFLFSLFPIAYLF